MTNETIKPSPAPLPRPLPRDRDFECIKRCRAAQVLGKNAPKCTERCALWHNRHGLA